MAVDLELVLKAALVPLAMLLASLAGRRFGHGMAGLLAGFPLIAGPLMLVLTLQLPAAALAAIVTATLMSLPATIGYLIVWAWLARRHAWWTCLAGATVVFLALGLLIGAASTWILASMPAAIALGIVLPMLSPAIGLRLMPGAPAEAAGLSAAAAGVAIPTGEIVVRMLVAFVTGLVVIAGAGNVHPALSGLLMTWPVTSTVLPAFTLALHGRAAAIVLLRGSVRGLLAFASFFLTLRAGLAAGLPQGLVYVAALGAPILLALVMRRNDRRRRRGRPSVPASRTSSPAAARSSARDRPPPPAAG